jgi:hypothetical protein
MPVKQMIERPQVGEDRGHQDQPSESSPQKVASAANRKCSFGAPKKVYSPPCIHVLNVAEQIRKNQLTAIARNDRY